MRYLRVKNWEKLQHQSTSPDRSPLPWIKFFTALLAPTKEPIMSEWSDQTKCLLYHVWLMARVHNGRIPETWLTKQKLNLKSKVNLVPILDSGFAWYEDENGQRLSFSRARDARSGLSGSEEERTSKGGPNYEDEFIPLWQDYPHRVGRKEALRHFTAARKNGHSVEEFRAALANYKAHIEHEQTQTKFIPHGSKWFNNWLDWRDGAPVTPSSSGRPGFTV